MGEKKKKIVFLTGAGMSVESGLTTFRDAGGLWENYPVQRVATHEGWDDDPAYVNDFYNMLRTKYRHVEPCDGHRMITSLEEEYEVTVVTQNVDALHEAAGTTNVIHLHGELMKMCSSRDVDDPRYHVCLPHEGWPDDGLTVPHGATAGDGSLLRPFIVFFGEGVPNIPVAVKAVEQADVFVVIGSSLVVYPAASLLYYVKPGTPVYVIDPNDVSAQRQGVKHIKKGASDGMRELIERLREERKA